MKIALKPISLTILFAILFTNSALLHAQLFVTATQRTETVEVEWSGQIDYNTTMMHTNSFKLPGGYIKSSTNSLFSSYYNSDSESWTLVRQHTSYSGTASIFIGSSDSYVFATRGSGDTVGLHNGDLYVPHDYQSGDQISSISFYDGKTLLSMGITPQQNTEAFSWGPGSEHKLLFTAIIASPIPEPLTSSSIIAAFCGLTMVLLQRKRHTKG